MKLQMTCVLVSITLCWAVPVIWVYSLGFRGSTSEDLEAAEHNPFGSLAIVQTDLQKVLFELVQLQDKLASHNPSLQDEPSKDDRGDESSKSDEEDQKQ